jgi:hypothetical protein
MSGISEIRVMARLQPASLKQAPMTFPSRYPQPNTVLMILPQPEIDCRAALRRRAIVVSGGDGDEC